ncbi:MAG TPA: glycosyltransferase family 2 protein [Polyangiaceae bacterium]|nr:glycosyltransferase family 2 protein [Polyangiaceae bacterium]
MQRAYLIPAYQAKTTLGAVIADLRAHDPEGNILVVDDGSTDGTGDVARAAGVDVVTHDVNSGKGVALRTGFAWLAERGFETAVTVDADGQHRAEDAVMLARHSASPKALLLGIRDLARDGAPKASQFSNKFSNWWVSLFSGQNLSDTQCGLRRYPLQGTLALGSDARGYGFECEMLVRAARRGIPIIEVPVQVIYPPKEQRISHFHVVYDPTRIVLRLVHTALTVRKRDGET